MCTSIHNARLIWNHQNHGLGRLADNLLAEKALAQICTSQLDQVDACLERSAVLELLEDADDGVFPVLEKCHTHCHSTQEVATALYDKFGFGYDHK